MRRLAWLLILGAGCGRIGIDSIATTDAVAVDAPPDAAPIPCAVEGSPCDDGNICTTSSTCSAGICVGTGPDTCMVARSEDDYSNIQGENSWFYGYWEVSTDGNGTYEPATDFRELVDFAGLWRPPSWEPEPGPNFTWAYLARWGGHPGSYPMVRVPIRRWVSTVSGRAGAVIHFISADTGGDGTRATLVVDGATKFERELPPEDLTGVDLTVPIDVVVGSTVDLLLHPVVDDGSDTSEMWMNIESR